MPTIEQARAWYPGNDPTHNFDHIRRVYQLVERLALAESADLEIVSAAALLHDAQGAAPQGVETRANHHQASADYAHEVLQAEGWSEERIMAVQHCIRAHRFRLPVEQPQTLEAKILFDADKLDAIGAIGVGRAIGYAVRRAQPVYALPSEKFMQTGQTEPGEPHSAYHEYVFKLIHLKERLYTPTGRGIAEERHRFMTEFFERLAAEERGDL